MAKTLVFIFLAAALYTIAGIDPGLIDKNILYYGTMSLILLLSYFIIDLFRNFKFSFQTLFIIVPVIIANYLIPYDINSSIENDFLNFFAIGVFSFFISSNSSFTNQKNIFFSSLLTYLVKLILLVLCLLLIGKQDNYYIQLFTENIWFIVLVVLSPAPFILIFSNAEERFVKTPIIKQFYNRTFFLIIFSLLLFIVLISTNQVAVSENISILIINSVACALLIAIALILYSLRNKTDIFFFLLLTIVLAYVINTTDYILDPFITFFFVGLFVNF